jgi:hypothetical protein
MKQDSLVWRYYCLTVVLVAAAVEVAVPRSQKLLGLKPAEA